MCWRYLVVFLTGGAVFTVWGFVCFDAGRCGAVSRSGSATFPWLVAGRSTQLVPRDAEIPQRLAAEPAGDTPFYESETWLKMESQTLALRAVSPLIECRVVSVHDGDTLLVEVPGLDPVFGQRLPVRLLGIDAPELNDTRPGMKQAAIEAREALSGLIKGKMVQVWRPQRDKYFRLLGEVKFRESDDSWHDASGWLVLRGHARPWAGRGPKPW